jgi:abortive infection bacteriophage resistance protein
MLSRFFSNLQTSDKKSIAKQFNNSNDRLFENWLHVLSVQRNICAHYGYLFRRMYAIRPIIAKSFSWSPTTNGELFAQLLVIKHLSDPQQWQRFVGVLDAKATNDKYFDLTDYGFPDNWKSLL